VGRFFLLFAALGLSAQTGENVLLIVNQPSAVSAQIAAYYRPRRSVPLANVCTISTTTAEEISLQVYEKEIEGNACRGRDGSWSLAG
jgi:surface antigen